MSVSWFLYSTATAPAAKRAVAATYDGLGSIVGEDLAEHLEPGEELEPVTLGHWPELSVLKSTPVPTPDEQRAELSQPDKTDVRLEEAALTRLAKCVSTVRIAGPQGFEPTLVSALRLLVAKLGPCVFTDAPGFTLETSETLLKNLTAERDLATALKVVTSGEPVEEEKESDEDEDYEDDEDEDEDEDEAEDEEETEDASARADILRGNLAEIAKLPRVRRKAGDFLAEAPQIVGTYAERLARIGVETDAAVAKALNVTEREVLGARNALARILRRAES